MAQENSTEESLFVQQMFISKYENCFGNTFRKHNAPYDSLCGVDKRY